MKRIVDLILIYGGLFILLAAIMFSAANSGCSNKVPVVPQASNTLVTAKEAPPNCVGSYPVTSCGTVYQVPCDCNYSSNCPFLVQYCTTTTITPTPTGTITPANTPTVSNTPLV